MLSRQKLHLRHSNFEEYHFPFEEFAVHLSLN